MKKIKILCVIDVPINEGKGVRELGKLKMRKRKGKKILCREKRPEKKFGVVSMRHRLTESGHFSGDAKYAPGDGVGYPNGSSISCCG